MMRYSQNTQSVAITADTNSVRGVANVSTTKYRYDAFISYSHDSRQSAIAEALQQAIQQFAKPFWKRRAVNLFRDQTNLSMNPDLWRDIEEALQQSKFFIFIASPHAAESRWVAKEIEWWLSNREVATILIVLVAGSLRWSGTRFVDSETTALPEQLRTAFVAEPYWSNLTSIATDPATEVWRRDDRFVAAVAAIAAPLRGMPKDELFGEDLRRHRQTLWVIRTTFAVITTLLLAAIGMAVIANEKRKQADQRADEASAAQIWSRLDFEGRNAPATETSVEAIWDLATSKPGVRDAFLRQVGENLSHVLKLGVRAGPVLRALHPPLGADEAQAALGSVLASMFSSYDRDQLAVLTQAVQVLGPRLDSEQAQAALDSILAAMLSSNDLVQIGVLTQAVQAVGPRLDSEQAQVGLDQLLAAATSTTDSRVLAALATAVHALRPTLKQAQAMLGPILIGIGRDPADLWDRAVLAQAVPKLSPTPEQSRVALGELLVAMAHHSDPKALEFAAQAIRALGLELAPEQAQLALGPILAAMANGADPSEFTVLSQAIQALGPTLGPEDAQAALHSVLAAMANSTSSAQLADFCRAVDSLGPRLGKEQAFATLGPILAGDSTSADFVQRVALVCAFQALGPRLGREQAQAMLRSVLAVMANSTSPIQLVELAQVVNILGPELGQKQARAALDPVLTAIGNSPAPEDLTLLAQAIQALGPTLGPEDAQAALHPVLAAMANSTSSIHLAELAHAVQALGPRLGAEQVQAALGSVLGAMAALGPKLNQAQAQSAMGRVHVAMANGTSATRLALAQAIQVLDPSQDQAGAALHPVLTIMGNNPNPVQLAELAEAVRALGPKLGPEEAQAALSLVSEKLAWTESSEAVTALAGAAAALLAHKPDREFATEIFRLLQYPTGAGEATNVLLDALQKRFPDAPGNEDEYEANVAWMHGRFPDSDFDTSPIFPPGAPVDTATGWSRQ